MPERKQPDENPTWLDRLRAGLRACFHPLPAGGKPTRQQMGLHAGYWLLALAAIWALQTWLAVNAAWRPIQYSDFLTLLHDHKVESVRVEGAKIYGELKQAPAPDQPRTFVTTAVPAELQPELQASGATFTGATPNTFWSSLFGWLLPIGIFYALWVLVWRPKVSGMGGLMGAGRSRARIYAETDIKTTFADVAGCDEAKEELKEIVDFLKDPTRYGRLGAHVPKGILLVGPPGTGKTLLARAVAGEAGVAFFSISGSEFVEMFVGVGAARVRDLFQQAHDKAPAIVFIDELDALGQARGRFATGGVDEKEQTLNQLLVELDGFDPTVGVVLLAATNRPDVLDPALLRAGRFDRQILVDRPDKPARAAILALHLKHIKAAADVQPDRVAELTPGMTGADLANVVNEAALLATRRGAVQVEISDISEAIERSMAGLARHTRVLSPQERETVAFHEMGHALVALSLPGADPVRKVSIIPRGMGALGYTIQLPTEDRYLITREELEVRMAVLLGGRAAEQLVFSRISTGAADDLQKATDIARAMVTRYGMAGELGPVTFERDRRSMLGDPMQPFQQPQRAFGDVVANAIDRLVHDLVQGALDQATRILTERRDTLEAAARALLQKETLTAEELAAFVGTAGRKAA
jgi:cell division protease FtsH